MGFLGTLVRKMTEYLNYDIRFVCHNNQDQLRIDVPGALQHIIAGGIERKRLFAEPKPKQHVINW